MTHVDAFRSVQFSSCAANESFRISGRSRSSCLGDAGVCTGAVHPAGVQGAESSRWGSGGEVTQKLCDIDAFCLMSCTSVFVNTKMHKLAFCRWIYFHLRSTILYWSFFLEVGAEIAFLVLGGAIAPIPHGSATGVEASWDYYWAVDEPWSVASPRRRWLEAFLARSRWEASRCCCTRAVLGTACSPTDSPISARTTICRVQTDEHGPNYCHNCRCPIYKISYDYLTIILR